MVGVMKSGFHAFLICQHGAQLHINFIAWDRYPQMAAFMQLHGHPTKSQFYCLGTQYAKEFYQDQKCVVIDLII